MIECDYCGLMYDGTACRWLCPRCKVKSCCCEGAPLPAVKVTDRSQSKLATCRG